MSAWEAISNTAPLCIALPYTRSKSVPVNGKHLQEKLFPPLAALGVHRVVHLVYEDFWSWFGAAQLNSEWSPGRRLDLHSSFPLPCTAAQLPGARSQKKKKKNKTPVWWRGPSSKDCQVYQIPSCQAGGLSPEPGQPFLRYKKPSW